MAYVGQEEQREEDGEADHGEEEGAGQGKHQEDGTQEDHPGVRGHVHGVGLAGLPLPAHVGRLTARRRVARRRAQYSCVV